MPKLPDIKTMRDEDKVKRQSQYFKDLSIRFKTPILVPYCVFQ